MIARQLVALEYLEAVGKLDRHRASPPGSHRRPADTSAQVVTSFQRLTS